MPETTNLKEANGPVSELSAELGFLRHALEESVKLQSHYANLLNMYDGGERLKFATVDEWISRLKECGA